MTDAPEAEELKLYAILRGDLIMSEGKANAQAGHAYVDALLHSLHHDDHLIQGWARAYAAARPGTKICLDGGSLSDLDRLSQALEAEGLPHIRITDRNHVELPHFDGSPIVTAIGIGPLPRDLRPRALRRLPLWVGGARACVDLQKIQKTSAFPKE